MIDLVRSRVMVDTSPSPERQDLATFKETVIRLLTWFFMCLYPGEDEEEFVIQMEADVGRMPTAMHLDRLERGCIRLLGERLESVPNKSMALRRLYEEFGELENGGWTYKPNLAIFVDDSGCFYRWRQSALRRRRVRGDPFQGQPVYLVSEEVGRRSRSRSR